jgi:hypothetical protein
MKGRFIALFSYAIAMAFLEAAVVVYLRALFYPNGFIVPAAAVNFSPFIYRVDFVREAATMVMLIAVAYLAFEKIKYKIVAFLWLFAIWDLFYYIFLKFILNWPPSLKTIDVLFLIPVPWIAPVWVPIIISSLTLIITSIIFFKGRDFA